MTYRDLTSKQIQRLRADCHKDFENFCKTQQGESVDKGAWEVAWSKAFFRGCNFLESKYKKLSLFDEILDPPKSR